MESSQNFQCKAFSVGPRYQGVLSSTLRSLSMPVLETVKSTLLSHSLLKYAEQSKQCICFHKFPQPLKHQKSITHMDRDRILFCARHIDK